MREHSKFEREKAGKTDRKKQVVWDDARMIISKAKIMHNHALLKVYKEVVEGFQLEKL